MTLRIRRIAYFSFIGVFLIIAPMLVLYTAGFRFNLARVRVERTGSLVVETEVRGATVSINGQPRGATPFEMSNLPPDTYRVTIDRAGYFSWQRQVTVSGSRTTFVKYIRLFHQTEPRIALKGVFRWVQLTPASRRMMLLHTPANQKPKLIWRTETTGATTAQPVPFDDSTATPQGFSPDDSWLLLRGLNRHNQTTFTIAHTRRPTMVQMSDITSLALPKMSWDAGPGATLYGVQPDGIFRINIDEKRISVVDRTGALDYAAEGALAYRMIALDGKAVLQRINRTTGKLTGTILLPAARRYRFLPAAPGLLAIAAEDGVWGISVLKTLAFDQPDQLVEQVIFQGDGTSIRWAPDGRRFAILNGNELNVFDAETRQRLLTVRRTKKIMQAAWAGEMPYLLYATENELVATEISEVPPNHYQLAKFDFITDFAVATDAKKAFIVGQRQDQEGLFELPLTE